MSSNHQTLAPGRSDDTTGRICWHRRVSASVGALGLSWVVRFPRKVIAVVRLFVHDTIEPSCIGAASCPVAESCVVITVELREREPMGKPSVPLRTICGSGPLRHQDSHGSHVSYTACDGLAEPFLSVKACGSGSRADVLPQWTFVSTNVRSI